MSGDLGAFAKEDKKLKRDKKDKKDKKEKKEKKEKKDKKSDEQVELVAEAEAESASPSLGDEDSAPTPETALPAIENASDTEDINVLKDENEKAMSRKEKRQAKKRKLEELNAPPAEKSDVPVRANAQENAVSVGNVPSKAAHGVWVGNLNFSTSKDVLLNWFKGLGLKDILRVNMPQGRKKFEHNQGFAYVDFGDVELQKKAIALSEQHLDGRKLLIKSSEDFTGRPGGRIATVSVSTAALLLTGNESKGVMRILQKQKNPAGPTLFLGNLGFETLNEDIRDLFNRNSRESPDDSDSEDGGDGGESSAGIRKVRMGTFEDTGKCKGWAFVDFETIEQATRALTNTRNHYLHGRTLKVEFASPEAVLRGAGKRAARTVRAGAQKKTQNTEEHEPSEHEREPKRRKNFVSDSDISRSAQVESTHMESEEKRKPTPHKKVDKAPNRRLKPGAALASAQRESVAIVPGQGKKIVFD